MLYGKQHFGRAWTGHEIEDFCPCPKAACGLVGGDTETVYCEQHSIMAMRTIRQFHNEFDCPAYKPHSVAWSIRAQDMGVEPKFSCSAPEGAPCRKNCPEGCESFTLEGHEHELVDAGECMLLPWLDNIGVSDTIGAYVGDPHAVSDGQVELNYVDEWVEWHYSDSPPTPPASSVVPPTGSEL